MSYKQKPKEMLPHFCSHSCFLPLPQRKMSKSACWRWKTHWLKSSHPICPGLDHLRSEYNQPRQQNCQLPRLRNLSHSNFWSCSCWKPTHQPVNEPVTCFVSEWEDEMWLCNCRMLVMSPDSKPKHLDYGPTSALINSVFCHLTWEGFS